MVSARRPALKGIRRPLVAFAGTAALIWWLDRNDGVYYVVGVSGAASDTFGPVLAAVCAGATVALVLSLVEAAAGAVAGVVAALTVLLLPSFIPLHRESLVGPPLLASMTFTLAAMVHAPRFSFAYGGAAAFAAVFVSPAAIGLPVSAALWAWLQARRRERRTGRRVALALAPVAGAVLLARWFGSDAWPLVAEMGWRGGLDAAAQAAGRVLGDQLAPGVGNAGIRWFIVADMTLIVCGLVALSWRRAVAPLPPDRIARRLFECAAIVAACYAAGLAVRTLLFVQAPNPGTPEVLPIAVVMAACVVTGAALMWRRWRRAVKVLALALAVGWAGAVFVLT